MSRIFISTFGCSMNRSDSERIAGILANNGFKIVDNEKSAELIIINSCTVKTPTIKKIRKYIKNHEHKKIVLAGCIPQAEPDFIQGVSMIGPSQIDSICEVVEETLNGNVIKNLVPVDSEKLDLPVIRMSGLIEVVPICEGCLGDPCSYCIVKSARGNLRSYPSEDIVRRIKKSVGQGVKEIWLTAQDTGCYGKDIGTDLVSLLGEVICIKGDFRVRLGMANPNHILPILGNMIKVYESEKMFKFLHIPVQSGNDKVLSDMKTHYSVDDFKTIVKKFRERFRLISISTDIICGFPEETEKEFRDSLELIRSIKPDVLNISRFWLRPGTYAEKLKPVDDDEIKKRSGTLTEVHDWIKRDINKIWLGMKCRVLVDEKGKGSSMVSRNESYKPVILPEDAEMGRFYDVKIERTYYHDLFGKII